jgi:hypothetical protein
LELDIALFRNGGLFDGNHLALHVGELGGRLFVTANEKCSGPKDHNSRSGY